MRRKHIFQIDDRIMRIFKRVQWDLLGILIAFLSLVFIRLSYFGSIPPQEVYPLYTTNSANDPHFIYSKPDMKNYSYEIKRDIFNFASPLETKDIKISPPQHAAVPMQKEAIPDILYKGIIISGNKKIAAFTSYDKDYIAVEGDTIDNKYTLSKINPDSLMFFDINAKKYFEVKKIIKEELK